MNNTINYYKYNKYKYKYLKKIGGACNFINSKTVFLLEDNTCPICFELLDNKEICIMGLSCNHVYCEECTIKSKTLLLINNIIYLIYIMHWDNCPICRMPIIHTHCNILTKITNNILNITDRHKIIEITSEDNNIYQAIVTFYELTLEERQILTINYIGIYMYYNLNPSVEVILTKALKYEFILTELNYLYIVLNSTDSIKERQNQINAYNSSVVNRLTYKQLDFMLKIKKKVVRDLEIKDLLPTNESLERIPIPSTPLLLLPTPPPPPLPPPPLL